MLSTKDVKTGGDGGTPKTITPGNHTLKVNNIELKQWSFMEKDNSYFVNLSVEPKPIEGFEGFFINPDDESLGRYEGQVGQVKSQRWFYKDGETKREKMIAGNITVDKLNDLSRFADIVDVSGALETNKVKDTQKIIEFVTCLKNINNEN